MFEYEILNAFVGGTVIVILGTLALKLLARFFMPNEAEFTERTTLKERVADRESAITRIRN